MIVTSTIENRTRLQIRYPPEYHYSRFTLRSNPNHHLLRPPNPNLTPSPPLQLSRLRPPTLRHRLTRPSRRRRALHPLRLLHRRTMLLCRRCRRRLSRPLTLRLGQPGFRWSRPGSCCRGGGSQGGQFVGRGGGRAVKFARGPAAGLGGLTPRGWFGECLCGLCGGLLGGLRADWWF